jgi:WD40 repeat protein
VTQPDLSLRSRFELVHRTGTSCTAVAFNLRNPSEFLIAMPDFTVKCFDAGTWNAFDGDQTDLRVLDKKEFVAWLKGHTTPVKEISVDSNGDFCITTSAEIAFLWELKTFERKRKLTITNKNDVCLFRVGRIEEKTHLVHLEL